MPVYDYRCQTCHRRFEATLSYREFNTDKEVRCPYCQSSQVHRCIGRVRVARSDDSRMDEMNDPSKFAELQNDPQAMGRMMRKMSAELGEDLGPEYTEMVSRLESGQSPDEIAESMPQSGVELDGIGNMDDGPAEDLNAPGVTSAIISKP